VSDTINKTRMAMSAVLEAASRLARAFVLALLGGAVLQIAVGCADIGESVAADATPSLLIVYPNQVFSTGKPGQLGLYIEGEDWHVLADMPGFEHQELPFTGPSQFLFMRNDTSGTTATVFAERIDGANSEESCRRHYARGVQEGRDRTASFVGDKGKVGEVAEIEAHGKTLLMYDWSISEFGPKKVKFWRRTMYWYPYYRGFCFDFHFSVASAAVQDDVLKVFDSVTYVAHKPIEEIDRLFYFDRFRIRLSIPIDWQYASRPPPPGPRGGIELLPAYGQDFSFLVIPHGGIRPSGPQPKDMAEESRIRLASRGVPVSGVSEVCTGDTCLYSFEYTDSRCDRPDPRCFPYWRQIYAKIGDEFLGLSSGYRNTGKGAADRIAAAFSHAKVLDLEEARKAPTQGEGKTAE
jgi:hypothetical protein